MRDVKGLYWETAITSILTVGDHSEVQAKSSSVETASQSHTAEICSTRTIIKNLSDAKGSGVWRLRCYQLWWAALGLDAVQAEPLCRAEHGHVSSLHYDVRRLTSAMRTISKQRDGCSGKGDGVC